MIIVLGVIGIYYFGISKNRNQTQNLEPQKTFILPKQTKYKLDIDSLMSYQAPEGFDKNIINPEPNSGPYTFQQVILKTPNFKAGGAGVKGNPGGVITIWINDNPYTQKDIDAQLHPSDPQAQRDCQNPTLTKIADSDAVTCEDNFEVEGYHAVVTIYHNNHRFNISYGFIPQEGKDYNNIIQSFLKTISFKD